MTVVTPPPISGATRLYTVGRSCGTRSQRSTGPFLRVLERIKRRALRGLSRSVLGLGVADCKRWVQVLVLAASVSGASLRTSPRLLLPSSPQRFEQIDLKLDQTGIGRGYCRVQGDEGLFRG